MLCFFLSFLASGQAGACDARILTGRVLVLGSGKEEEDGRGPGFMLELGAVLLVLAAATGNRRLAANKREKNAFELAADSTAPCSFRGIAVAATLRWSLLCWLLVAGPASAVA
ncbi:hypothetical protein BJ166DRAFT_306955 [Pestalotiopsis sp. NC0098]|nr:hypothetical protein BJ166DRAFT_306955 [Pestalotiopsis sp. NC0098]